MRLLFTGGHIAAHHHLGSLQLAVADIKEILSHHFKVVALKKLSELSKGVLLFLCPVLGQIEILASCRMEEPQPKPTCLQYQGQSVTLHGAFFGNTHFVSYDIGFRSILLAKVAIFLQSSKFLLIYFVFSSFIRNFVGRNLKPSTI